MTNANHLLAMSTPTMIVLIVAGALCALTCLYGVFRKFSRTSWLGYQLALLFGATLLIRFLPALDALWNFVAVAGGFFGAAAIVLGAGAILRHKIKTRKKRVHTFWRVTDRILGALTALVNLAALVFVLGTAAAAVMFDVLAAPPEFLAPLEELAVWQDFGHYALDFLLIAFLTLAIKAGYKLGANRKLWLGLALILTVAALFGSVILVAKVPFLAAIAEKIAGTMSGENALVGVIVGHMATSLLVFLVAFIVIVLLTLLVGFLVKNLTKLTAFNVAMGMLLAVIFYAVALCVAVGIYIGLGLLEGLVATQDVVTALDEYLNNLFAVLARAPFTSVFFGFDPFIG